MVEVYVSLGACRPQVEEGWVEEVYGWECAKVCWRFLLMVWSDCTPRLQHTLFCVRSWLAVGYPTARRYVRVVSPGWGRVQCHCENLGPFRLLWGYGASLWRHQTEICNGTFGTRGTPSTLHL